MPVAAEADEVELRSLHGRLAAPKPVDDHGDDYGLRLRGAATRPPWSSPWS